MRPVFLQKKKWRRWAREGRRGFLKNPPHPKNFWADASASAGWGLDGATRLRERAAWQGSRKAAGTFYRFSVNAAGRPQGIFKKIPRTPKTFGQMLSHLRGEVWAAIRSFVRGDAFEKLTKIYFIDLLQCDQICYFNIACT